MNGERLPRIYLKLILVLALAVVCGLTIWQKSIPLGLDLRGGTELLYRIRTETLSAAEQRDITQTTIDVIRKRIDPEGRMELDIRPRGNYRFYIQLPGMKPEEVRRIEDLIRRAGKLRFCLVNDGTEDRAAALRGEQVPGHVPFLPVQDKSGQTVRWRKGSYVELAKLHEAGKAPPDWMLVEKTPRVTGEYLVNPHPTEDETGLPAVGFAFKGRGRVVFEKVTEENIGKRLAIILDEDLYSAPVIESRIAGAGIIRGRFTRAEVDDLISTLRAGQLPADIELEWAHTVGAQLGEDSIRAGIRASIVALALTLGFMAVYYLVGGLIADFAVLLNLLLILGAMAGLQSVMTLPGIAGLVLSLAMAVDANVLINERVREESARGKTLRLAVRSGYERAFVTILDSNLTTLITGLILFGVGTGPVRGFAVTLCLGIVISLFTAVWVTRWIVDALIGAGWLTSLRMAQLFGRTSVPFTRARHLAMAGSAVCIVAGIAVFLGRGREKYDTDLTGGFRAEMELQRGVPIAEFRKRVGKIFRNADVQSIWTTAEAAPAAAAPKLFSIRIRELTEEQKISKLRDDLTAMLRTRGLFRAIEGADPADPWQSRLKLSAPVTEAALRDMLREHRYTDAAIREIVLLDQQADEFVIMMRPGALSERRPDAEIAQALEALKPFIAAQDVRITIGEIAREESPRTEKGHEVAYGYVPIRLGEICSTAAVREAIIRHILNGERPEDLRVSGHGADAGSEMAREMAVRGKESDLQKIVKSKKTVFEVLSFSMATLGELRVLLNERRSETAVRDRLAEAGVLDRLVRYVLPVGVAGQEFLVSMHPLSEEKAVEKIREELINEFKAEITAEGASAAAALQADLTPIDTPQFVPEEERPADARFFKLTLGREIQIQEIQAILQGIGLSDALVVEGDINKTEVARRTVREAVIRLRGTAEEIGPRCEAILKTFRQRQADPFRSIESIGPVVAGEMKNKALLAVILSCVAIVFYIWFRFGEVKFGLAAVIALIHDVLMTAGAVGVADALSGTPIGNLLGFSDIKINVTMIAAFLTLVGYSVNDTIVVFDRIRENMGGVRRRVDAALVDASVNQTLSRTFLTGLTTIFVLLVLYIMGGPVVHGFAFVMLFGCMVGTYSSIFIAAPILIGWESYMAGLRRLGRIVTFRFS